MRWMPGLLLLLITALFACGKGDSADGSADQDSTKVAEAEADGEAEAEDGEEGENESEESEGRPARERAINVTASPALQGDLVLPIIAEGSVRARRTSEIKFEIAGRIEEIHVNEGQRVRRGQALISLDDREYRVALEEAKARYLDALGKLAVEQDQVSSDESAARELQQKLDELEELEKTGTITREERRAREIELGVDAVKDGAYRRELLEVRSGLAAARADEQRATLNLERTVLRAPFDGVVSGMTLNRGERISAQSLFCTLVDDVDLEAEVGVLESDLGTLVTGRAALLDVPALGEHLPAKVDVISPSIDATSRTCKVLLRVRNTDGKLRPGMFVRASIAGRILEDRLLVPREALLTRDGRPLVFREEDGRAKWVYVKIGERNDHLVEITGTLQGGTLEAGDLVVIDNHLTLTHEAAVKVSKRVEAEDPWLAIAEKVERN